MPQRSPSNETTSGAVQPHPWLQKHYEEKRQRTVRLVKAAVDQLVKEKQTVTIEAICQVSIGLDPAGRGVKKSAVLENAEAHAYYREHSTSYQTMKQRKRSPKRKSSSPVPQPLRIDPNRDEDRARYRYLQLTKAEMVERLLTVEQAFAEAQQQLAQLQFELVEMQQLQATSRAGTSAAHQKKTRERKPSNGSTNNA